jgi:hypothetical protein
MKRIIIAASIALSLTLNTLGAQEAIHSSDDLHYDFLALVGEAERPYLNYKTLSDSDWDGKEAWRLYGPELFTSYNSNAPYGTNDGALWQGRGFNTSLTGGARYAEHGFELTLKPQLVFSQNQDFDLMYSPYETEYGYIWGSDPGTGVDAPQRFGDDPLFGYSWGDSEVRYTWKKATVGFGTQSPWLGPGRVNAIIHSNNAPPYPKFDVGLRRSSLTLFGRYLGDVEARLWAGYLSESDFFDSDASNDHNMISGLAVAYAPSIARGLTFFANRTYLAPWEAESAKSLASLFFVDLKGGGAQDVWDQRASVGFDYLLSAAGVEVYGEIGINDYGPSFEGYIRYPFHSMVYTAGLRKSVAIPKRDDIRGEFIFEWTDLEMSQDFQFLDASTFYMHYQIVQGYTNGGQWLGAGIGTGGNSQYLGFRLYYPRGTSEIFIMRVNPDNDYLYALTVGDDNSAAVAARVADFKTTLTFGINTTRAFTGGLSLLLGTAATWIQNPQYDSIGFGNTEDEWNFRLELGASWKL